MDGNNVLAVVHAAREAVERARRGKGPRLIVAETYRLLARGRASEASLADLRGSVDEELDSAVSEALEKPFPAPVDATTGVYAEQYANRPWTRRSPVGYADASIRGLDPAPVA